jgi:predicted GNAT family acetyltransferase
VREPGMPDLALIELQAQALFVHDEDGRIVRINEPQGAAAPRFFLGRTREGNIWRLRADLPSRLARELEAIAAKEPVATDLQAAPVFYERYCDLLTAHKEIHSIYAGPAYVFPTEIAPPEKVVRISASNSVLLQRGFGAAAAEEFEARSPCVVVVEEGMAVCICFSSRITPRVAEAGVETLEPYRRRGYAARAVAGWALAVRERGRLPLYSTSWENTASQAVAGKLGLRLYGVDLSIR